MNFVSEKPEIFFSSARLPRWQSSVWVCMAMLLLSPLATGFQMPAPSDCSRINHRQYAYQHKQTSKLSRLSVSSVRKHPSWNNTVESSSQPMLLLQELEKELDHQRSKLEEILEESSLNLVIEEDVMWDMTSEWASSTSSISLSSEIVAPVPTTTYPPIDSQKSFTLFGDVWDARLLLLVSAALYGTNFAFVKLLGETIPSVGVSSTIRFGMATLATLPWLIAPDDDDEDEIGHLSATLETAETPIDGWFQLPFFQSSTSTTVINNRHQRNRYFGISSTSMAAILAGFEVGMYNSVGYVAQAVGLECTDASKSAFLCSLAVVIVPMVDFLAGKPLQRKQILGAAMAVGGVGFLELGGLCSAGGGGGVGESVQMVTANSWNSLSSGDIASLLQPFAFGVGFWRMEDAMQKYPHCAQRITAAQLLAIFLASALYALVLSSDPLPHQSQMVGWLTDPTIVGALFWTGVITTALTIYMETVAMKTLSAAETTLIFSTEPLWGLVTASIVMGETFGMNAAMGATLILGGCIVSNIGFGGLSLVGENDKGDEIT